MPSGPERDAALKRAHAFFAQIIPILQEANGGIINTYDDGGPVNDDITGTGIFTPYQGELEYTEDKYADGGIAHLAGGSFPRMSGAISGPGGPKDDMVPAMLSDGEFVMTADAVRNAGGGDRREGARRMYQLMNQLQGVA